MSNAFLTSLHVCDEESAGRTARALMELLVRDARTRQDAYDTAKAAWDMHGWFIPLPEPELREETEVAAAVENMHLPLRGRARDAVRRGSLSVLEHHGVRWPS